MRKALLFNFLLEATIIASIAIVLTLIVRKCFRRQLGNKAIVFAWLLVAIRLLYCCVLLCALLTALIGQTACAGEYTYFTESEQTSYAQSCLTEVFGYPAKEAESFVFEHTETDGIATLKYWYREHPEWVYVATFSLTDGQILTSKSPFHSSFSGYPGENSVRYDLNKICEQGLLNNWNKTSREAFRTILEEDGFKGRADEIA